MEHYFQSANNFRYRKTTRHEFLSVRVINILNSPVSIILLRLLTSELLPERELIDKQLVVSFNIIY
jgi:hypothetical protein